MLTHHRTLIWQLGCSSLGHSVAMPWSPSLLSPRSSSCSEGLEATTPHRSSQLADVRPQFSSLGAQEGQLGWEAPAAPTTPSAPPPPPQPGPALT